MGILQWIVIGALVYAIYYLINKYERRVDELTRLIELNREEIARNRENIKKNAEGVEANKQKIEKNAEGVSKNRERLDLNQAIIEKLK